MEVECEEEKDGLENDVQSIRSLLKPNVFDNIRVLQLIISSATGSTDRHSRSDD